MARQQRTLPVTLVVDASVAAKWVLPEPGSADAVALRTQDPDLIAPSLVAAEIGNAIWKSVRRGDTGSADAPNALRAAVGHYTRLIADESVAAKAMELALELNHPIYDCFYLALAERERAPLVSADKRLIAMAKRTKRIEVRAL
jgi:predicted nucleic acid-binding protein